MKLVASLIVAEVEADRYLIPCVASLLEFCDEVVLLFDGDGRWAPDRLMGAWEDAGSNVVGVTPGVGEGPVDFFAHEGRARQRLLDATLARDPSHVLAIDADEFVADGQAVRAACDGGGFDVWTLCMQEIWNAHPTRLDVRQDGGWEEHEVPILWAPGRLPKPLRIADRQLACGREPQAVRSLPRGCADTSVLHFGWARREERQRRYQRYAVADGGRFHQSAHLQSILLPDDQIRLTQMPWPPALLPHRDLILAHAGVK